MVTLSSSEAMKSLAFITFVLFQTLLFADSSNGVPVDHQVDPNSKAIDAKADPTPAPGFAIPGLGTIGNGDQFVLMGSFQGIGSKLDASSLPSMPSLPGK